MLFYWEFMDFMGHVCRVYRVKVSPKVRKSP